MKFHLYFDSEVANRMLGNVANRIQKMKCHHDYECNDGEICVDRKCENANCKNDFDCHRMDPKLKCLAKPKNNSIPDPTDRSCKQTCNHSLECGVHQICSKVIGGCITPRCHEKAQVKNWSLELLHLISCQ